MKHKYVFIAGLHRSGTSLFQRMLSDYAETSCFENTGAPEDEGQHLQTVFSAAKEFGGPGAFAFDHGSHMNEDHHLVNDDSYGKLMHQWGKHWDMSKPILVEKSPPNIVRSRFLQELFPRSYFIFLMRNPIAVTMATSKWSDLSITRLMEHWIEAYKIMEKDIPYLENSIKIKYEDLTSNPNKIMGQIEEFLQISHEKTHQEIYKGINDVYFEAWEDAIDNDEIDIDDIKPLVKKCKRLGYDISEFI